MLSKITLGSKNYPVRPLNFGQLEDAMPIYRQVFTDLQTNKITSALTIVSIALRTTAPEMTLEKIRSEDFVGEAVLTHALVNDLLEAVVEIGVISGLQKRKSTEKAAPGEVQATEPREPVAEAT